MNLSTINRRAFATGRDNSLFIFFSHNEDVIG